MCDSCNYNHMHINNDDLEICTTCKNIIPTKLITKTDAIKNYVLNNNDLDGVRHISYRTMYTTYLYLIEDVEYVAIKKHGSIDKLNDKICKKKELVIARKRNKDNLISLRKKELTEYLNSINVELRTDSVLCSNYIEKGEKSGFTPQQIGDILKEMDFYFNCTNYKTMLPTYRRQLQNSYYYNDYYNYNRWTDKDEERLRSKVKDIAMCEYIKQNFLDTHKIILEVPYSLKSVANKYTKQFYDQLHNKPVVKLIVEPKTEPKIEPKVKSISEPTINTTINTTIKLINKTMHRVYNTVKQDNLRFASTDNQFNEIVNSFL
jgi:hypothetical protein